MTAMPATKFARNNQNCLIAWFVLALFCAAPVFCQTAWKAGVAKVKITPTESIWLAGYGARTKPSEGVLQDIYAKALALQDAQGGISVLVTADLLGFNRQMSDGIAQGVRKKYGLSRDRLVLNASHTHSAPVTGNLLRPAYALPPEQETVVRNYTTRLIDQVVDLIGASIQNRALPASPSTGVA